MGGGGLFCKNDTGLRGLLFQLYTTALFLYLPLLLRKPVFVLGIGFYPNANTLITRLACFAFRFVQRLTVRDEISYRFLKSKHLPVAIYKDMSFLMPLIKKKTQKKYNKSFVVGLALNTPHDSIGTKKVIEEVAKFMIKHHKTTHFTLYTLDYHPSYYNDLSFADEIIQHTSPYAISYDVVTSSSPDTVFSSFQSLNFVIGSRLHASIFSHRLHIPFYAVSYDKKCESFLKSINHNYSLPHKVTEKEMSKAFKHTQKKYKPKKESTISESTRLYQGATL
jgi:polysaccharide pyruvyl transferase WcaK-like protein